jgi:hypothetical protein
MNDHHPPTDAVYIYSHSAPGDSELRLSLRSVAQNAPWIRKVWIFGDRPEWLSTNTSIIEHVKHEQMAKPFRFRTPVRNGFLLTFLASLIPGLSDEFLWFADDYILLRPVSRADLFQVRVFEDLANVTTRGKGRYKDALWRTHETLVRLGYGSLNFEVHLPLPYTRKRIWDAYCAFQDFVSEDRFFGFLCHLAVFSYAQKHEPLTELIWLQEEGKFLGFYHAPVPYDEVIRRCHGRTFLNFDDKAFGGGIARYLVESFSLRSQFESESFG